jgi:lipopolysaccharide transport system ATP-binding protein
MSDIIIKAENLGKKYTIGHHTSNGSYMALRDVLMQHARSLWHKTKDLVQGRPIIAGDEVEEFWALKDINFEIRRGETVGIIGCNGAGKSTLLKLLSRITEPSAGRVTIKGRVASLLEVGTGFHPELTGRENIYLNGAILGMTRAEIRRKFDEIVAFAEIEKFLDTPVKRYSSGMYVRLAFAVAAHLEPEILIVDEVLAVGDAQFQKKCLGKMDEVGREGRTVLFVSHNMGVISQLCPTCIWLDQGKIKDIGQTASVVNAYMLDGTSKLCGEITFPDDMKKDAQLKEIKLLDIEGNVSQKFDCDSPINIKLEILVRKPVPGLYGYIGLCKPDGTKVLISDSYDAATTNTLENLPIGMNTIMVVIPPRTLGHGEYMLQFGLASHMADNFYMDQPGLVCSFSLDDFASKRGNQRAGFFSTLLPWCKLEN